MTGITSHFRLLSEQLRETSARHVIASQNIANVNTPGYKSKEVVSFSNAMQDASDSHDGMVIRRQTGLSDRLDGNNVDIDREMGGLKKNALLHNAYTQILASKIRQMRSAISGR